MVGRFNSFDKINETASNPKKYGIKELDESNVNEDKEADQKFDYMMLGRLASDCEYFLNYGNGSERHLHQGNLEDQIKEMKKLWNGLHKKPEWLTMEEILDYEDNMKNYKKK